MQQSNSNIGATDNQVIVKSAVDLTTIELQQIKIVLESKFKKKLILKNLVDDNLIAGLYIRIGDQVYDQTLRKRLESLRERLSS